MLNTLEIIGLIISVLLGAIALVVYYRKRRKIRATGAIHVYKLPPSESSNVRQLIEEHEHRRISYVSERSHLDRLAVGDDAVMAVFDVENAALAEVVDLKLHLPITGVYCIGDAENAGFKNEIDLGRLRSRQKLTVRVWPSDHIGYFSWQTDTYLSHPDAHVPVKFPYPIYGDLGAFAREIQRAPFIPLVFALLFAAMFIALLVTGDPETPETESTTTQPVPVP